MRLRLETAGSVFTADLYSNPVAEQLFRTLPLELTLNDFNGVEKVGRLDPALRLVGVPDSDSPQPSEIGYYAPTQGLVLYYGHVGRWRGLVRIGRFDLSLARLREIPDGARLRIEQA